MLTKAQNTLYFREWGAVRKALIDGGRTPKESDAMRHVLTERVLGYDKPHARLTNAEFDAILGAFRAISRADDIDAQLRQLEQPIERARRVVADLQASMHLSDAYIAGTCRNICKRSLAECTVQDLTTKIIPALTYHRNRLAKRSAETTAADTDGDPF
jgi:hypothetical protein